MKRLFFQNITPETALQFSQLSRQGTMILTGVLLVKSHLSLETIGIYEMLMYLVGVTTFFWVNGLIQGFMSVYPKLSPERQHSFINEVYSVFVVLSLLILLLLYLFQDALLPILTGNDSLPYLQITGLYFLLQISSFLLDYLLFLKKKIRLQILNSGLHLSALLAVILPLWFWNDLYFSILALTGLAAIRHIWLISITGIPFRYLQADLHLKKWLIISFPLVLYALFAGFAQYFDLWLISIFSKGDTESFVLFRYGAREIPVSLIMATTFSTAMIPLVAQNINQLDELKKRSEKLMHFLFPFTLILLLFSEFLFRAFYSSEFDASVPVFNIFLLLIISRMLFPQTLLIAMEKTAVLLKIAIAEMLVKIVLSLCFYYCWGMIGLAWSTVIAALFEKTMYVIILKRSYNIDFQHYTPIKWWALYSVMLLVLYILR